MSFYVLCYWLPETIILVGFNFQVIPVKRPFCTSLSIYHVSFHTFYTYLMCPYVSCLGLDLMCLSMPHVFFQDLVCLSHISFFLCPIFEHTCLHDIRLRSTCHLPHCYIHEYDSLVNYLGKGLIFDFISFYNNTYNSCIFNVNFYFYFFSLQNLFILGLNDGLLI